MWVVVVLAAWHATLLKGKVEENDKPLSS